MGYVFQPVIFFYQKADFGQLPPVADIFPHMTNQPNRQLRCIVSSTLNEQSYLLDTTSYSNIKLLSSATISTS